MKSDSNIKKMIVPAVTMLVAVTMMLGVGYAALSSTFETTKNVVSGGDFKVVVDNSTGSYIFNDAKIPYSINTTNGEESYVLDTETTFILCKDKTVTITDNTGQYDKYSISVTVTSDKLRSVGTLEGQIIKNSSAITEITKNENSGLTLKVTFTPTVSTVTGADALSASDIVEKIKVTGIASAS